MLLGLRPQRDDHHRVGSEELLGLDPGEVAKDRAARGGGLRDCQRCEAGQ